MSKPRKTEKKTKIKMNICWNIYVLSSANLTLFRSVTRARIYLTNNTYVPSVPSKTTRGLPLQALLLQCFWRRGDVIPRGTGQTFYAPVPTRFTLVRSHGTYKPDDIRPPCRHASRTFRSTRNTVSLSTWQVCDQ